MPKFARQTDVGGSVDIARAMICPVTAGWGAATAAAWPGLPAEIKPAPLNSASAPAVSTRERTRDTDRLLLIPSPPGYPECRSEFQAHLDSCDTRQAHCSRPECEDQHTYE